METQTVFRAYPGQERRKTEGSSVEWERVCGHGSAGEALGAVGVPERVAGPAFADFVALEACVVAAGAVEAAVLVAPFGRAEAAVPAVKAVVVGSVVPVAVGGVVGQVDGQEAVVDGGASGRATGHSDG